LGQKERAVLIRVLTRPGATPRRICVVPTLMSTARSFWPRGSWARTSTAAPTREVKARMRFRAQASANTAPSTRSSASVTSPRPPRPPAWAAGAVCGAANIGSLQLAQALGGAHDIRQADAEALVDDHHLAVGDEGAVHEHIERLAGPAIELDDRALVELQQVAGRNARTPDRQRHRDGDVEDDVEVDVAARRLTLVLHLLELGGLDRIGVGVHLRLSGLKFRESGGGAPMRRTRVSTLTACWPRERPKLPRNSGTSSASSVTL